MSSPVPTASGFTVVTQVYPQQSGAAAPASFTAPAVSSPLEKFLKGEPKALGIVQIMIGGINILFGFVRLVFVDSIGVISGIVFWGGIIFITSGSLAVAAAKNLNSCLVRGSLGMNIISSITAGIAIIIFSFDVALEMAYFYCQYYDCVQLEHIYQSISDGVSGVLLVLSILEFIISICVSVFACKAVCNPTAEQAVFVQTQQAPIKYLNQGYLPNATENTHNIIYESNLGQSILNHSAYSNSSETQPSKEQKIRHQQRETSEENSNMAEQRIQSRA